MSHLRLRLCVVIGALLALVGAANAFAAGNRRHQPGLRRRRQCRRLVHARLHRALQPRQRLRASERHVRPVRERDRHRQLRRQHDADHRVAQHRASARPVLPDSGGEHAAVGAPLPTADLVDGTPINMAGSAGKVALVDRRGDTRLQRRLDAPCSPAAAGADRRSRRLRERELLRGRRRGADADDTRRLRLATRRAARHRQQQRRLLRAHASRSAELLESARSVRRAADADQSERHRRGEPRLRASRSAVDSHAPPSRRARTRPARGSRSRAT